MKLSDLTGNSEIHAYIKKVQCFLHLTYENAEQNRLYGYGYQY